IEGKRDSEPLGTEVQSAISMASVPLLVQERIVGVLALVNAADHAFHREDIQRLEALAYPVATAVENARLFWESERQRAAIMATSQLLAQPLLIIDDQGAVLVANAAANKLMDTSLSQLLNGISQSVGGTSEVTIGQQTFLTSTEHVPEIGTIAIMQDITAAKQLEEARANFIHMLSHDLKNPMTSITGWTTLLQRTQPIDAQGHHYLRHIDLATTRMLNMVNQLLSSVTDETSIQLHKRPCRLDKLVDMVLADARGSAVHKQMQLETTTQGDPYPILADETRLYHLLLNLVDNAIKYAPPATRVQVDLFFADRLTIRVHDEGPGIPDEYLGRVFDKYFRNPNADVAQTPAGTGLGLAVVKAVVEEHGGMVTASNKPAGGAMMTIELPETLRLPDDAPHGMP
ncbi:MAG: GAF domain-containing sensor histidine kinase, partial [Anaerolineales bacterium]|nr:GAF domain-containing sensor histidine kinase [Anaerolineales bacterium]